MIIREWNGYQEGRDITKIPSEFFTTPTKNVLIFKNKAYMRPGLTAFGAAHTAETKIHGEYVWKDAGIGELAIRTTARKVQVYLEQHKTGVGWVDIFGALNVDVQRVRFATWIDSSDAIIHKRLFFVDGSVDMYDWNGAVGVVASVAGDVITLVAGKSAEALGFDDGSSTPQTVIINGAEYTYNNDPTAQTLSLTSTPTVAAGDLVIAKPKVATTNISGFKKDHIHTYKNHVMVASLDSVQCYFSHLATYPLTYTVPAPASRTAATAFFVNLDGNVTATTERKNKLWISTEDDWFELIKTNIANAFDLYVEVEKNDTTERNGSLPYAVSNFRGDTVFVAQDKTVQMITDLELIQSDSIKLLSDQIQGLLQRTDLTECRVVVHERYIYIIAPSAATLIMYDTVDGFWQPPQQIAMGFLSIISGQLVGHSNARDESFNLFQGRQDLGVDFDAVFALPFIDNDNDFTLKQFAKTAISGRTTESAVITWENYFDTDGEKGHLTREVLASQMRLYAGSGGAGWGSLPFGTAPYAGEVPETDSDLKRFFLFDAPTAIPYFEFRPIITVSGESTDFHLLAYEVESKMASRKVSNDHYIKSGQ